MLSRVEDVLLLCGTVYTVCIYRKISSLLAAEQ